MKKTKLLSILAVSPLLLCGLAMLNNGQPKLASAAGSDELAPWGECEEDFTDSITGHSFASSSEEHLLGEKSWKLDATDKQIRLSVSPNGSIYQGSAFFKGAAGTKVTLIGVLPYQADGAWATGYFDSFPSITLTGEWDEYKFAFSCKQDGDDILMDKNGDGAYEDAAKLTGTYGAVNMLFRFTAGPVYMDHFNYHVKGEIPAGSLQGDGSAETSNLGPDWKCYPRSYEDSYKGGYSYKVSNNSQARLNNPAVDGTLYEGSLKVKGEKDATFNLTGIFTCADAEVAGSYVYGYLDAYQAITLTGGWDTFNFSFSLVGDSDAHTLEIHRTGAAKVDGDPTVQKFGGVAGFDLRTDISSGTAYIDEIYIVAKQGEAEPEIDYSDAVVYYNFDESTAPFEQLGGTSGSTVHTTEAGEVHSGAGAMKVKGVWSCYTDSACEWIQQGDFLEFSAFVKNLSTPTSSAAYVQLQTWSCDKNDPTAGWAGVNTRIDLVHYNNGATSDSFKLLKGKFGIYSDGTESFIYHNGKLIDAEIPAGNVVAPQIRFDIGATDPDFLAYDDVAIMKTTVKKNATLAVSGLTSPSVEVYKGETKLEDAVIEANGNSIVVKDLVYGNFKDQYTLKIYDGDTLVGERQVSFARSEVSYSPAYTANITVKDVEGQVITDAVVSYGNEQVTENNNGVYSIANISGDLQLTVSKEGYIPVKVTVTVDNHDAEVTLKQPKPTTEYEDNMLPKNAGMEDGWTFSPNKQGLDFTVVDNEQYEGSNSLRISASKDDAQTLFRIQDGPNYSGKTYRLEAMVKAEENQTAHFSMGACFTCQSKSGWAYGWAYGESVEVSDEWTLVTMTFSYEFDPLAGTLATSANGGEPVVNNDIVSVAAYDFVLKLANENEVAYIDDLAMYEVYQTKVTVTGEDGNPVKNAIFTLTDARGNEGTPNIAYNEEQGGYIFEGLYGAETLVATAGDVTYDAVKITKATAAAGVNIEKSYSITLTLKDQNGDVVTGATVVARKGITTIGTFTEVGNGVYTLEGVMGEVTIVITKDNYEFDKFTVSASNATLTVTGTNNTPVTPIEPEEPEEPTKKGCKGSIIMTSVVTTIVAGLGVALSLKKRKED